MALGGQLILDPCLLILTQALPQYLIVDNLSTQKVDGALEAGNILTTSFQTEDTPTLTTLFVQGHTTEISKDVTASVTMFSTSTIPENMKNSLSSNV